MTGRDVIHRSPLPDVEIPDVLLPELVLRRAADVPDKAALIEGVTGRVLTYGELDDAVRRLAGGLVAHAFAPGDVVAIMAPNSPEYAVVFHGVGFAGGVVTTINPTYTEAEVRHQLEDAGPRILVTDADCLDTALAASAGTSVQSTYVIGDAAIDGIPRLVALFADPVSEPVDVPFDAPFAIPYSSGTTGLAKGVVLSHRALVAGVMQTLAPFALRADEKIAAVLPFFHIFGIQVLMNAPITAGATVITMPRFALQPYLQLLQDFAVTRAFVAPPIVAALAKDPIVDKFDLSGLEQVFSGAAPLSPGLAGEASARLGCEVVQGYGMTEMAPGTHLGPNRSSKPGSVGVTAPNSEIKVVDPVTGDAMHVGEDGEVCMRGPQMMTAYLNNPRATSDTIDEHGWLHTGDIGHVDDDGYLYVIDRLKEMIKYKGFQVAPAELEAVLLTHPAVADAAVIGEPDDIAGEVPVAFVVLKEATTATEDDIAEFVATRLAHFKRLAKVTFTDKVPRSASGKILRRLLRDQARPPT
ncbi:MAG: AMP-binding protein [Acidimicrobiia bacterium]